MSKTIIIIGAGLAGLSAALQAAENGCNVKLVSSLPSERAQSVMAEGGINAALNTKDENDSPEDPWRIPVFTPTTVKIPSPTESIASMILS